MTQTGVGQEKLAFQKAAVRKETAAEYMFKVIEHFNNVDDGLL